MDVSALIRLRRRHTQPLWENVLPGDAIITDVGDVLLVTPDHTDRGRNEIAYTELPLKGYDLISVYTPNDNEHLYEDERWSAVMTNDGILHSIVD